MGMRTLALFLTTCATLLSPSTSVKVVVKDKHMVIDNGILQLNLTNPEGDVSGITYNGVSNLLEAKCDAETRRGYWDISWGTTKAPKENENGFHVQFSESKVIAQNESMVEVSFKTTWSSTKLSKNPPLTIDKRFVVLKGSSGFYIYGIYEHQKDWPAVNIYELRVAFRLSKSKFNYMAISDDRQRFMPVEEDRSPGRAETLAFKEAVLLTNPSEPQFRGEVDDKYQYAMDNKDNKVQGWMSSDPSIGFWIITPSNEFKTGGPMKQDLTSHAGPIALSMFVSLHYGGEALAINLNSGEYWKKVFGPVFVYLNNNTGKVDHAKLWEDAKSQMETEVKSWPYSFPASEDFPKASQRGSVNGRLLVTDKLGNVTNAPAKSAHVGLAPQGEVGSWQTESKGYQFWTTTGTDGSFTISNVIAGDYNLYAWVPGFIGDFRKNESVKITPGGSVHLGDLTYEPPRDGPTLWEIGIPDRTAGEFFIPDPSPQLVNKLYASGAVAAKYKYKQYGLWNRYTDLYPTEDLVYTVGVSNYRKDWFYAQVNRRTGNKTNAPYEPTTWKVKFNLASVTPNRAYKLRIALASATNSVLQVWFNSEVGPPHFSTGRITSRNNAVARHGIHGFYYLFSADIESSKLVTGENVVFLAQRNKGGPFQGVMYDYIRLEAPSS